MAFTVAIDGPAAAGKGTIARAVAAHFGFSHLDTAGQAASKVAAIPEVRSALLKFQQDFARREGGAVLDGRDIGTVICPNAEVKLFVTASDAVRAQRRFAELSATNPALTVAQVAGDLAQRDARDAERAIAPLQPADDAELLDTSTLSIAAAIQSAIATVQKRLK